jgi:hypothetical protein
MAAAHPPTAAEFLTKVLEAEKKTDHICWNCKHFKWVIKDSKLPPADLIGWCKKTQWPFYACITETPVIRKCYAFEPIQ